MEEMIKQIELAFQKIKMEQLKMRDEIITQQMELRERWRGMH